MKIFNDVNSYKLAEKMEIEGAKVILETISKSFLEIEVGDFEWDIPFYGVDKEMALHLKNKLSLLGRDLQYPINKDKTLILGVDSDVDDNLMKVINDFKNTYKDMDNICLVFDK